MSATTGGAGNDAGAPDAVPQELVDSFRRRFLERLSPLTAVALRHGAAPSEAVNIALPVLTQFMIDETMTMSQAVSLVAARTTRRGL